MLTSIMKWISVTMLFLAGLGLAASYRVLLELVVCVSGLLVITQAVKAGKYFWAAGFLAIAAVFNLVMPVVLSRKTVLWLDWVCLMTFLISLAALKNQPILSVPSITHRTPGAETL